MRAGRERLAANTLTALDVRAATVHPVPGAVPHLAPAVGQARLLQLDEHVVRALLPADAEPREARRACIRRYME